MIWQRLSKNILPQICILCHEASYEILCQPCMQALPWQNSTSCAICAKPLSAKQTQCGDCLNTPPHFDYTQAIFHYKPPLKHLIHHAKYNENLAILRKLAHLMAAHIRCESPPDIVLPVPLHPRRLISRGYNQSHEMAKIITNQHKLILQSHACIRIRNTPMQINMKLQQRPKNVRNAFKLNHWQDEWQHVVIVDDVMTTGSTVNEMAKLLKKQGVQKVGVWCCARA
jgi:ComF family protein